MVILVAITELEWVVVEIKQVVGDNSRASWF